jgi:hypothetical protein
MIEKQYYVRVTYIPDTYDDRRQDGTYLIKHFDEVMDKCMGIDTRIVSYSGTPASAYYFECVVDSLKAAERIEKVIEAILTRYKYRGM